MQTPSVRSVDVLETVSWSRTYWHSGAHAVKVHFRLVPLGKTCARQQYAPFQRNAAGREGQYKPRGLISPCMPRQHNPLHVYFKLGPNIQERPLSPRSRKWRTGRCVSYKVHAGVVKERSLCMAGAARRMRGICHGYCMLACRVRRVSYLNEDGVACRGLVMKRCMLACRVSHLDKDGVAGGSGVAAAAAELGERGHVEQRRVAEDEHAGRRDGERGQRNCTGAGGTLRSGRVLQQRQHVAYVHSAMYVYKGPVANAGRAASSATACACL